MFRVVERARRGRRGRRLLHLLYAITVLMLGLFLWATIRTFNSYSSANRSIRESNTVLQELETMVSGLKDAQIGVRGYMLTHDTSYVLPFRLAQPVVQRSIHRLDSLNRAGATDQDLEPIQELSRQLLKEIQDQFLAERNSPIGVHGMKKRRMRNSEQLLERVRGEQDRLVAAIGKERDQYLSAERRIEPDTPTMLLFFALLATAATSLLFWRLTRALNKAERAENEISLKVEELNHEVHIREFAERLLKRVLDSSPSAIMAFRSVRNARGEVADLEWIMANQGAEREFAQGEGLVGKRLLVEMGWMRDTELHAAMLEVIDSGIPYERVQPSAMRSGIWEHVHVLRLLDGLVVTITDITETRRAQDLLAESDRLAITGGIARTIAHEVRNPLTNLSMALEQMLEELEPAQREQVGAYSAILQRNIRRIAKLITDLLESSKPKELEKRPCQVKALLESTLKTVKDRMELLEMQARVEVASGVTSVMADREAMITALGNLCVNAIEAMEPGKGRLLLKAGLHGERVRIIVADNGKGVDPEDIKHLFQAFYSGRTGGMGLGLTTARTIFTAHGIHMDVESTVDEGTTFSLTFPVPGEA